MQMNFSIKFWVSHEFLVQTWLFIQVFLTSPQRVPHYVKIPHNAGWDYKHFPTTEGVQTQPNLILRHTYLNHYFDKHVCLYVLPSVS